MAAATSGGYHTNTLGHSILCMIILNQKISQPFNKDLRPIYKHQEEREDYNVT